jgi:hypothetical protein
MVKNYGSPDLFSNGKIWGTWSTAGGPSAWWVHCGPGTGVRWGLTGEGEEDETGL